MEATCLSLAAILRCESLSRTEQIGLFVVDALQILCIFTLLFFKWDAADTREYLLLVISDFFLVIISLLDFIAHVVPENLTAWQVFKALDVIAGASSFIPIGFYTLFLFYLARSHLIPFLPASQKTLCSYVLPAFIPLIIAFNEVGSFLGISYGTADDGINAPMLVVSFSDRDVWVFFNSLTLAALASYQAVIFGLLAIKLIKSSASEYQDHLPASDYSKFWVIRGSAWVALGINLGVVEAVVGFALDGFGVSLSRRVLRLVGRACLVIGLIKGMDSYENFHILDANEIASQTRRLSANRLRQMISNPRNSTFARLSPSARAFHNLPRAVHQEGEMRQRQFGNLDPSHERATPEKRVTVHYDGASPPRLDIRISRLDLLSIRSGRSNASAASASTSDKRSRKTSYPFAGPASAPAEGTIQLPLPVVHPAQRRSTMSEGLLHQQILRPYNVSSGLERKEMSGSEGYAKNLASLPSRKIRPQFFPPLSATPSGYTSRRLSLSTASDPIPRSPLTPLPEIAVHLSEPSGRTETDKGIIPWRRARARKYRPMNLSIDSTLAPPNGRHVDYEIYVSGTPQSVEFRESTMRQRQPISPRLNSPISVYSTATTPVSNPFASGKYRYSDSIISDSMSRQSMAMPTHLELPSPQEPQTGGSGSTQRPLLAQHGAIHSGSPGNSNRLSTGHSPTLNPWIPRTRVSGILNGAKADMKDAWKKTGLERIKTIGVVSARRTPTPTRTHGEMKGSVKLDLGQIQRLKTNNSYGSSLEGVVEPPLTMESERSAVLSSGRESTAFTLEPNESDVKGKDLQSTFAARRDEYQQQNEIERQDLIDYLPNFGGPSSYESGMLSSQTRRDSGVFGDHDRTFVAES